MQSKKSPVYAAQAKFLALTIDNLVRKYNRDFRHIEGDIIESPDDANAFHNSIEYEMFSEALHACGFVCTDLSPTYPFDEATRYPERILRNESFDGLRHYLHTLQRAVKNSSNHSNYIFAALQSGALSIVAERLENDLSLYDSI